MSHKYNIIGFSQQAFEVFEANGILFIHRYSNSENGIVKHWTWNWELQVGDGGLDSVTTSTVNLGEHYLSNKRVKIVFFIAVLCL